MALNLSNVQCFILSWDRVRDLVAPIYSEVARVVDTVVISSDGGVKKPAPYTFPGAKVISLSTEAYFTDQINEVLTYFRNGQKQIAYIIVADTKLINGPYHDLIFKALYTYNTLTPWGMYCPWEIGKQTFPRETSTQPTTGVYEIPKAYRYAPDLGHCFIHKKLLELMPARWDTNVSKFGWGIDRLYADKARAKGWSVLLDTNYNIDHLPGRGYDEIEAYNQSIKLKKHYKNHLRYDITWRS